MVFMHAPESARIVTQRIAKSLEETLGSAADFVTVDLRSFSLQAGFRFDLGSVNFKVFGRGDVKQQRAPHNVPYEIARVDYHVKRHGAATGLSSGEEINLLATVYGLQTEFHTVDDFVIASLYQRDSRIAVAYLNQHGFWIRPEGKNLRPSIEGTKYEGLRLVNALEDYFGMPAVPSVDALDTKVTDLNLLFWHDASLDSKSRFQFPIGYRRTFELSRVVLEYVTVRGKPVIRVVEPNYFENELLGNTVPDAGLVAYEWRIELAQRAALGELDPQGRLVLPKRFRELLGMNPKDVLLFIGSGDRDYFFVTLKKYFPDVNKRLPDAQLLG